MSAISRCKLVYAGWIDNKVLLCSTRNYIQCPVINHSGKEYEKEYIYLNHSVVHQKLAEHCKSTMFQFKKAKAKCQDFPGGSSG